MEPGDDVDVSTAVLRLRRTCSRLAAVLVFVSGAVGSWGSCANTANVGNTPLVAGQLEVLPRTPSKFGGKPGGPFQPAGASYTLRNAGGADVVWSVEAAEEWLQVEEPSHGVLRPQSSVPIPVTLRTARAAALPPGKHTATLRFRVGAETGIGGSVEDRTVNLEIVAPSSVPIASAGWTTFAPSADTRKVYVSATGNDDDDGLSTSKPKRTLAAARALLRDGYPDWLLLKRGDVWPESLGQWKKSGRSPSEPLLVSTYGSSKVRPRLETGTQGGIWTMPAAESPATVDNVAIVGLHFLADPHSLSGDCVGIRILQPGSHWLLEDCQVEGYSTNIVFQAYSHAGPVRHHDFKLRRSTIVDAHCPHETGAHPQGLYASGVDELLLEENLFDHNGWSETVPGAGADVFSHDIYVDNGNSGVVVRGNIIANAGSHGLQLRCGGAVVDNFFFRNAIALLVGGGNDPEPAGVTADVRGNVVLEGKNIDAATPRGFGMCFANIASGRVARNLITHNTLGTQPIALMLQGKQTGDTRRSLGVHDLVIERNIVFDWGGGLVFDGNAKELTNVELDHNDVQEHSPLRTLVEHRDPAGAASIRMTGNRFHAEVAPGAAHPSASDRAPATGQPGPSDAPVTYPDPHRSLGSFLHSKVGVPADPAGGSAAGADEAFLQRARAQSALDWRPELTAAAVNRYLREGFGLAPE